MTVQLKDALGKVDEAVKTAEAKLGASPAYADSAYFQRRKAVFAECEAHLALSIGARINDRWNGCSVRIAGVSSTCTAGLPGALQNWMTAARRKLEAEA
jgi:hypothetical protein